MRFKDKVQNKLYNEFEPIPIDNRLEPVVYTGMQNQKTVVTFDDYFEHETITRLINKIESIRQIGGYDEIDLYFTSLGGVADTMFILADYLNNIKDIRINLLINGMVASCGFYILLLIENPNVDLIFNEHCSGLIHLGDTYISARGQLTSEESRYNWEKFRAEDLKRLNDYFKKEIIPKLNLSKKDMKQLNEGRDVMFHGDELEKIVNEYHNNRYFNSDEAVEHYVNLQQKISEYAMLIGDFKDKFQQYTGKDIDKELGIEYEDEEVEFIDDNRGSDKPCV